MARDAGVDLAGRSLAYEAGGRPYFPDLSIDFSITHTEALVACALSVSSSDAPLLRIGLDAEARGVRSPESMARIASRFFSDAEREAFLAAPDESTFLRIWTGKEALCKQDGIGLSGIARFDTLAPENLRRLTVYHTPSAILTLAASEACEIAFEG
jgi:phosphopantetheinyl transferase